MRERTSCWRNLLSSRPTSPKPSTRVTRRRQFHEALLDAATFEDLPGRWQAAIVSAEENRPDLRIIGSD
jgi:hypothetical protein